MELRHSLLMMGEGRDGGGCHEPYPLTLILPHRGGRTIFWLNWGPRTIGNTFRYVSKCAALKGRDVVHYIKMYGDHSPVGNDIRVVPFLFLGAFRVGRSFPLFFFFGEASPCPVKYPVVSG